MEFGTTYGDVKGKYDINIAYPGLSTFQIVAENKGARLEYFSSYYRGGKGIAGFGFDDGTTGRFLEERDDPGKEDCNNTCGTPRSELKTTTEFMGCTYNFTECFFSSAYKVHAFLNRTTSESVNRIRLKVYDDEKDMDMLLVEKMHLITDTDEVIGSE